ncbi:hypothetical protein CISIN_1g042963mg [Citrus sinensis]|uniref:Uncharacterized protein n=1 Tax=Citrus sinensis TaxID=2711 RepID=A0A067DNT5_CITSI|nr:hypothetical protein CISIN_1g042963mg [Citrus sinensis]
MRKVSFLIEKARVSKGHDVLFLRLDYTGITLSEEQLKYTEMKVKEAGLQQFFGCCESLLAEHGLLLLQFSSVPDQCYDEHRLSPGFMKEYVFPGGCLPSLNRITSTMTSSSRLCEILDLGFSEKFLRTWEYYFDYCAAGFKSRTLRNYEVVFSRPGNVAVFSNPHESFPSA